MKRTIAVLLATLLGSSFDLTAAADFRTVALSGEQAPGTSPGVTFFSLLSEPTVNPPGPQIDDAGNVAFAANLIGSDRVTDSEIWFERGGALQLLARQGDRPGALPDDASYWRLVDHNFQTDNSDSQQQP